jgi:putative transcriptional regulator
MAQRNIAKEIIAGLEEFKAWKAGEKKLVTNTVELPHAADVSKIREKLGLSQPAFASFMGVSVHTLRNWEQLRREPQGPARALLMVAAKQPAAVREVFEASLARKPTAAKAGASPSTAAKAPRVSLGKPAVRAGAKAAHRTTAKKIVA